MTRARPSPCAAERPRKGLLLYRTVAGARTAARAGASRPVRDRLTAPCSETASVVPPEECALDEDPTRPRPRASAAAASASTAASPGGKCRRRRRPRLRPRLARASARHAPPTLLDSRSLLVLSAPQASRAGGRVRGASRRTAGRWRRTLRRIRATPYGSVEPPIHVFAVLGRSTRKSRKRCVASVELAAKRGRWRPRTARRQRGLGQRRSLLAHSRAPLAFWVHGSRRSSSI